MNTIDVRGLSCPQPVMNTLEEINNAGSGTFRILVDTDTSKENVIRSVEARGWSVQQIDNDDKGYAIVINK
ncbi:MAG: sulfurtransferase TusA family protein [Dissulfurispiraceae bacterium]|nr:sulfurtransferase TusA family protein [Dissulfurispiraceae bacterium]